MSFISKCINSISRYLPAIKRQPPEGNSKEVHLWLSRVFKYIYCSATKHGSMMMIVFFRTLDKEPCAYLGRWYILYIARPTRERTQKEQQPQLKVLRPLRLHFCGYTATLCCYMKAAASAVFVLSALLRRLTQKTRDCCFAPDASIATTTAPSKQWDLAL